jgi:hypothetical protein
MERFFPHALLGFVFTSLLMVISVTQAFASCTTLVYDDGVMNSGLVPCSEEIGGEVAVRFTPTSYPAKLQSIQFFVSGSSAEFAVRIYEDDSGFYPGRRLDSGNISGTSDGRNEWVTIDVSAEGITINEGGFYVSMYWLTAPGSSCKNPAQTVGLDTTEPIDGRSFLKWGGSSNWHALSDTTGGDRDAMIRAIVGDCVLIGADLSMPIPDVTYNGKQYGFTLKFYSNPDDPSGLYWKMDMSTLEMK